MSPSIFHTLSVASNDIIQRVVPGPDLYQFLNGSELKSLSPDVQLLAAKVQDMVSGQLKLLGYHSLLTPFQAANKSLIPREQLHQFKLLASSLRQRFPDAWQKLSAPGVDRGSIHEFVDKFNAAQLSPAAWRRLS